MNMTGIDASVPGHHRLQAGIVDAVNLILRQRRMRSSFFRIDSKVGFRAAYSRVASPTDSEKTVSTLPQEGENQPGRLGPE
jgi:hypothetical protein